MSISTIAVGVKENTIIPLLSQPKAHKANGNSIAITPEALADEDAAVGCRKSVEKLGTKIPRDCAACVKAAIPHPVVEALCGRQQLRGVSGASSVDQLI
jgi:hypothetical protein